VRTPTPMMLWCGRRSRSVCVAAVAPARSDRAAAAGYEPAEPAKRHRTRHAAAGRRRTTRGNGPTTAREPCVQDWSAEQVKGSRSSIGPTPCDGCFAIGRQGRQPAVYLPLAGCVVKFALLDAVQKAFPLVTVVRQHPAGRIPCHAHQHPLTSPPAR